MSHKATKNIEALLAQQEQILQGLKQEAKALDNDAVTIENERLSKALGEQLDKNKQLSDDNKRLSSELESTKNVLFTKMADEKLAAFTRVQQRIDSAYYTADDMAQSRLALYEHNCLRSIDATQKAIESYGEAEFGEISKKLAAIARELEEKRRQVDAYRRQQLDSAYQHNSAIGANLRNEPLTEIEKKNATAHKSVESFIGLNILSKLGILLLLVGIILLGRFAYTHMSDVLKGVLIYALGGVLIGGGELFHKKEKNVFSTALISGGVAVLYAATATSLFAFKLFDEQMAFIVCIAVTAIAILISNQIKSWIVCAFATVGGYLPLVAAFMISFGAAAASKTYLPAAAVYFTLLAVVVFILTNNKKWYIAQYIGYAFQIVAVGGIASCAWSLRNLNGYGYALGLAAGFAVVSYLVYLMMPASKLLRKQELDMPDLALLGMNTVSGAISTAVTLYNCFGNGARGNRAVGFAFVVFAAIYAGLSLLSGKRRSENSVLEGALLYTSVLIFSMLIVPFLFGWKYAALAWAAEGALLAVISIKKDLRVPEYAGLGCMVISFIPYFAEQLGVDANTNYPPISIITLCIILVSFWAYVVCGLANDKARTNYFAALEIPLAVGTFAYMIYLYNALLASPKITFYCDFTTNAVYAAFALIAALCVRFGILKNRISIAFSDIAGIVIALYTVVFVDAVERYKDVFNYYSDSPIKAPNAYTITNLVLLFVINICVILFFSKVVSSIINELDISVWTYTASISVLALAMITAVLMRQFGVAFSSVIISGLYIAAACVLLFIGFRKKFSVVRLGGLIMILVAFAKLCFVDTRGLDSAFKIVSYFAFGGILIFISFIYQRFSKKLTSDA